MEETMKNSRVKRGRRERKNHTHAEYMEGGKKCKGKKKERQNMGKMAGKNERVTDLINIVSLIKRSLPV
jgi:hypothetical protein